MSLIPISPSVLCDRELEVLRLLGLGFTQRKIRATLHITEVKLQTIKGHIYRKLKIRKPIELAHYCLFYMLIRNLFDAEIKHATAPRHD
jgi:DNA-binding NarL/FixJ family response regulator